MGSNVLSIFSGVFSFWKSQNPLQNTKMSFGIELLPANISPLSTSEKLLSDILFDSEGKCNNKFLMLLQQHSDQLIGIPYESKVHFLLIAIKSGDVENMIEMFDLFMTPYLCIYDKNTGETIISMGFHSGNPFMGHVIRDILQAQQNELHDSENRYKKTQDPTYHGPSEGSNCHVLKLLNKYKVDNRMDEVNAKWAATYGSRL